VSGGFLLSVLTEGEAATRLRPRAWEALLKEARGPMLTARLAEQAKAEGWYDRIPLGPRRHLEAACRTCASQQHMVRWEVGQIERALAAFDAPVVLLKGSAYVMAGLPAADGRIFSDIDIMVPREHLHRAEGALIPHGWISNVNAYDREYYEKWMHELPALQHVQRSSVIDLHHTITPPTSRTPVDAAKLFPAARPLAGSRLFFVLAPADMLLHSAVHLIQEGEFWHGLRDLVDLDALFRDFGSDAGFWPTLIARAAELRLGRPLYYAVQQARRLLKTPMPQDFLAGVDRFRPAFLTRRIMGSVLGTALAGASAGASTRQVDRARWLLYVRGHYVRMPLALLIPHLIRKGGARLAAIGRHRSGESLPVGGARTAN
jgi:hypothetical protein